MQQRNFLYSEWAQQTPLLERVEELQLEIAECLAEAKEQRWGEFQDEIGDVLWDCLGVIARAEHEGKFTVQDVLNHVYAKFTERKPYLLERRKVSRAKEHELWEQVKKKQKNARNRS